jgi:lysophospholipase L1-like esterase
MHPPSRVFLHAAYAAVLLLLVTAAVLRPLGSSASAASPEYVALGDSFASGVGTRTYYSESGSCYRSPKAYPVLDAARVGAELRFKACGGAKTGDVLNNQLGPLDVGTDLVTVQVGGNDAGFSNVMTTCAQPSWAADCHAAIDKAQAYIRNTLPGRLDDVYAAIRVKAVAADVTAVGYPRLFMGVDCNSGTWFTSKEMTRLNQTADLLNAAIRDRAAAVEFGFADPTGAFTGHAICADVEWINGLSNPTRESFHPNVRGQAGYANLVDDFLG